MRIVRTSRGARLVQKGAVLSEVLSSPGPTHSLFDVLAACVAALAPGPRVALLGFAGGGIVAPLRAMGFAHPLDAVDLSSRGEEIFHELSAGWAGEVRLFRGEASRWLRDRVLRYDMIVEDLSVPARRGVRKPDVSLEVLPELIRRKLRPDGLAVVNTLLTPGATWAGTLRRLAAPFPRARVVTFDRFENRLLIAGRQADPAREISRRLGATLRKAGSREAGRLSVRSLTRD